MILHFLATLILKMWHSLLSHSLPGVSAFLARIGLFVKVIVSQIKDTKQWGQKQTCRHKTRTKGTHHRSALRAEYANIMHTEKHAGLSLS